MPPTNQLENVGDRYRLGERIGGGGMGEVYAAHDLRLDREVALKLLRADLAEQDGMRERVLAEARLAARLTHPNVVAVIDTGEQDGRPFVVMERLSGRTLRDELAAGPMEPDRVRDVGLQVLRALGTAHDLGIVHRDVKPGNVLDAGVGTWKVADFGIAKWIRADETLTGTGELLGSPSYLAPERIEGDEAGPASDLYAVGVLLYETLTGTKPFSGDDPVSLATQIREGRFTPPTEVLPGADPGVVAVIDRAMRLDPDERFPSAEAMAEALSGEEGTAGGAAPTARLSAVDRSSDATKTVPVPKLEQTAILPVEPATPEATPEAIHEAAPAAVPPPSPSRTRFLLILAGAVVAIALVTVMAIAAFGGRDATPPDAGAGNSGLPTELEDALQRLEDSVRP
jgi:eukaryotic-like serine/threonine-protein kinase